MLKIIQNLALDSNINIAILNGNPTCTTSKQLYLNVIVTQQKLYPFESHKPSLMMKIGLLRYFVSKVLQLFSND